MGMKQRIADDMKAAMKAKEQARLDERQLPKLFRGVVMQAVLARRRVFDRIGSFDPSRRFCEDTDWYLRAAEAQVRTTLKVLGQLQAGAVAWRTPET